MITDSDVTLTDYGLMIECFLFVYLFFRKRSIRSPTRMWFIIFFSSIGLSALFGGTVHGFFLDPLSAGHLVLWPLTMIAIGIAALALWGIGAEIQFSNKIKRWFMLGCLGIFAIYSFIVVFLMQPFWLAIADYLPAVFFLTFVFLKVHLKKPEKRVLVGICGLILMLVAAAVQYAKIAIHPVYFNHNAFYHLIQSFALFLLFYSGLWFIGHKS